MLTDNYKITSLGHECITNILSSKYSISLEEAAEVVKQLSFSEYNSLLEASADIPSPSGQSNISPTSSAGSSSGTAANSGSSGLGGATAAGAIPWKGTGVPVQQGMAVGIKDPKTGLVMPHQVTKTDGQGGATVTDPTTGKISTYNEKDLLALGKSKGMANPMQKTTNAITGLVQSHDYGDKELNRILELAGLKEDGSSGGCGAGATAGATVSGNIATVAVPLGAVKKRKLAKEKSDSTVSGKIDPNAASGELAQKLSDRKMKSATRHHNGIR